MKFTEIPKFTRTATYHVDILLEDLKDWIERKEEMNLQLNPDFQRGHVWVKEQQIAYVEYLLRGGSSGREIYFNHPGWMKDWKGDFICVDGLQRITACLAFLNDEIPTGGLLCSEFEDDVRMADVSLSVNINDLETRKEVLTWYIEMNSGGTIHTDIEINRVKLLLSNEYTHK
ncbi:hypothetical protein KAU33_15985 [Candidatus Dependentiae bacterium]|nr:hypothetical protein [Candidatus Dependentiae bacterium]